MSDIIQADYEALDTIARIFSEQSEDVAETLSRVTMQVEVLQNGAWMSDSANWFYGDYYNDLKPGLERCYRALDEASTVTRQIIAIIREAEQDAANQFKEGYGDGQFNGPLRSMADGGLNGYPPGEANAIYINGIQTDHASFMRDAARLEDMTGLKFMGIYNGTAGVLDTGEIASDFVDYAKSVGNFVLDPSVENSVNVLGRGIAFGSSLFGGIAGFGSDGAQAISDILPIRAEDFGIDYDINPAVSSLKEQVLASNGQPLTIYAHSQGGGITSAALVELADQGVDLSNVKVVTFGGFGFDFPDSVQQQHFSTYTDPVPFGNHLQGDITYVDGHWHGMENYLDQYEKRL